jgi:hypothetical protein
VLLPIARIDCPPPPAVVIVAFVIVRRSIYSRSGVTNKLLCDLQAYTHACVREGVIINFQTVKFKFKLEERRKNRKKRHTNKNSDRK